MQETIAPGSSITLEIRVKALSVELLRSTLTISIDGHEEPMHVLLNGTVAAPHLIVPSLNFNFNVMRVNTDKQIFVEVRNTGNFVVGYEILINNETAPGVFENKKNDNENVEITRKGDVLNVGCMSLSPCFSKIHPGKKIRIILSGK